MPIDAFQAELLTNQGDCPLHYHLRDQTPTRDTLGGIQSVANIVTPTGSSYSVTDKDDYIQCAQTMTVTLPVSRGGKEYEVTQVGSGMSTTIVPSGTDTIIGTNSVIITVQWTSLRFKSVTGGWIII